MDEGRKYEQKRGRGKGAQGSENTKGLSRIFDLGSEVGSDSPANSLVQEVKN